MAHDVFISYAMEDKPIADALCAALESESIRCWIAPRDVLPGSDWSDSILSSIAQSRAMVLIFSSSANKSVQIKREVNHAIEKGLPVIPFRIENVDPTGALEYYLDVTHWLDALTPPMEKHIQLLASTVKRLLDKPEPPRPLPPPPSRPRNNKLLWIGGVAAMLAAIITIGVLAGMNRNGAKKSADANVNGPLLPNTNGNNKTGPVNENMAGPSRETIELISTAAADLANPNLRIDAILRLEQLARRSKDDHWRVVQVLTEHVRKYAPWTGGTNRSAKQIPSDIQTILSVLGRRQWWYKNGEDVPLELGGTDLRGVDLRIPGGGAHFEGVRLNDAHLEEAYLRGIHFEDAILYGAHFNRADLYGAYFGAYVNGKLVQEADVADANFEGADLTSITGIPISRIKGLAYTDGAKFSP